MSATHGFSIDGVVAAHAHQGSAPERNDLCIVCGRRLAVCGCERDQFDADLRGDHDSVLSYWAEREAREHFEATR